jgi:hypothetical protein
MEGRATLVCQVHFESQFFHVEGINESVNNPYFPA